MAPTIMDSVFPMVVAFWHDFFGAAAPHHSSDLPTFDTRARQDQVDTHRDTVVDSPVLGVGIPPPR